MSLGRLGHETDDSSAFGAVDRKEWSCTSTVPYVTIISDMKFVYFVTQSCIEIHYALRTSLYFISFIYIR